jgi:acyl-CoA reductase-like NAD-dependent aldehyde dehydrogenase
LLIWQGSASTILCAWALADILSRSGLPQGVFNLVMGRGSEIGEAILQHPAVAAVSFTGSIETGRRSQMSWKGYGSRDSVQAPLTLITAFGRLASSST